MARGDHIYIQCTPHTHHGIDLGNGRIIEYSRVEGIRVRSMKDFSENKTVNTKQYDCWCFPTEEIIKRAYSRLGEKKYCLLSNNCEHFACWCKTGVRESEQINKVKRFADPTKYISVPAAMVNVAGQTLAASAAKKSLNPISNIGTVGGAVAEGIKGGAVEAVAMLQHVFYLV